MGTPTPFGYWPSPLDARTVATERRSRSTLASDGRALYWVERRPEEDGRNVVVRVVPGHAVAEPRAPTEMTPPGTNVRSGVHEYGGGAFCLLPGEPPALAWVEQADQAVRLLRPGEDPVTLPPPPPEGERWAHGDLRATPDGRWVVCVRERHLAGPSPAVRRALVAYPVPLPGDHRRGPPSSDGAPAAGVETSSGASPAEPSVLAAGRDFYAAPRPDRSGRWLAWTCWDHPDMPWDASEVWVGALEPDGATGLRLAASQRVDGGRGSGSGGDDVSVGQPGWDAAGGLVYVSDRGGWWRPWRWHPGGGRRPLLEDEAEYHGPDWALGQATLVPLDDGHLVARRRRDGIDALVEVDPAEGTWRPLVQPCVTIGAVCAHGDGLAWLGATPAAPNAPWWRPAGGDAAPRPVVEEATVLGAGDVSTAVPFTCRGRSGTVHGLYYAPRLSGVDGPDGSLPPLVVHCHGGPTGAAEPGFDPLVQFFTSRGFAVAAVDYTGSTGYGRAYRQALAGRWGEVDVDDCVDAACFLADDGRVDRGRMAIRGSSAGGLTALGALVRADVFAAAVSWYGVTDLVALAAATHDFESRYTERLVGPLPAAEETYRRRSPAHRTADVHGAVLLLQGLDDPVVPPTQATVMAEALQARGVPCELVTFPDESHGFRRAETVVRCLRAELDFYRHRLSLDPGTGSKDPERGR